MATLSSWIIFGAFVVLIAITGLFFLISPPGGTSGQTQSPQVSQSPVQTTPSENQETGN